MLQQTRVEVAGPYFERFLARFPDVESLAVAELDDVLALWSGLGYYRRARQLHAAARQIAGSGEGFPSTVAGLLELPGVGPYTAAAVASIAFDVAVPAVDGNVERVAARLIALEDDPRTAAGRREITALAGRLVDPRRPGDSNQALMELGATVCTPRRPRCSACPLRDPSPSPGGGDEWPGCRTALGDQPHRPTPPRRGRAREHRRRLVALVEDTAGRVLLFRRADSAAVLAGTWELPSVRWPGGSADPPDGELAARYGGRWQVGGHVATVRHAITFRDLELVVHRADLEGSDVGEVTEATWHHRQELGGLPLSSIVGKVLAAVAAGRRPAPAAGSQPTRAARRRR